MGYGNSVQELSLLEIRYVSGGAGWDREMTYKVFETGVNAIGYLMTAGINVWLNTAKSSSAVITITLVGGVVVFYITREIIQSFNNIISVLGGFAFSVLAMDGFMNRFQPVKRD